MVNRCPKPIIMEIEDGIIRTNTIEKINHFDNLLQDLFSKLVFAPFIKADLSRIVEDEYVTLAILWDPKSLYFIPKESESLMPGKIKKINDLIGIKSYRINLKIPIKLIEEKYNDKQTVFAVMNQCIQSLAFAGIMNASKDKNG